MRIPMSEDLGNALARTERAPGIVQGSAGEGVAQAMRQTGSQMQRVGAIQMHEERQQREAAERAQADIVLQRTADELFVAGEEMGQGVKGGQIDSKEAASIWGQRSSEVLSTRLNEVPEHLRERVKASLEGHALRAGRLISKAVTDREQSDVRAGIDQTLEAASRLYLENPGQAENMVRDAIEMQGPYSGLDAQQLGRIQQKWREDTRFNRAATLVQQARNSNGQLDGVSKLLGSEEFADMTPERRLQLTTQIEGFKTSNIQRAEAARARAEAQAAAHLNRAQAAYNAAQGLLQSGKTLRPEYVEQLTKATAGTPFAQALPDLIKQGPERTAFASQPLAVQQKILQQARAKTNAEGTTPEMEKHLASLQRMFEESQRDYSQDPLRAAQERGLLEDVAPLDTSSIPGVTAGLAQRMEQANIVRGVVGRPVSPLLPEEAEKLGTMLNGLPVEQKTTALAQISEVVGPETATAISTQIANKDKALGYAFAMGAKKTTQGRYSSELVLRGAQAIKDRSIKEDNSAMTGVRAMVSEIIGDTLSGQAREAAIDAATLIYYGKQAEGDRIDAANAVNLAVGTVAEHAGRKFILPYGVNQKQFQTRLRTYPVDTLKGQLPDGKLYVGKTPLDPSEFLAQLPNAPLLNQGDGRYAVQAGGGVITNSAGKPVVLEIK